MGENYLKIVLQAIAEKIDRLSGEVYIRDLEIERLKREKAEAEKYAASVEQQLALYKKECEKLTSATKTLEKAIAQEVINDG